MTGTETEGFESESGRTPGGGWALTDAEAAEVLRVSGERDAEVLGAHARPEPDTDGMPSLLPELPPSVDLRNEIVDQLSAALKADPFTRNARFAKLLLGFISTVETWASEGKVAERWRTP